AGIGRLRTRDPDLHVIHIGHQAGRPDWRLLVGHDVMTAAPASAGYPSPCRMLPAHACQLAHERSCWPVEHRLHAQPGPDMRLGAYPTARISGKVESTDERHCVVNDHEVLMM